MTELLQYLIEPGDLLKAESEALLAGIVLDTKNFTNRTGGRTFEAAAYLRRAGADTADVQRMFQSDLQSMISRYDIIRRAELYHGDIAIAALDQECDRVIAAKAAVNGIRFVLKEPMSLPSPIYMPIDSKRLEKVEIRAALPGRRSVYPRSKIITLFGGLDQKGMPTNKLVSKPLPPDLGSKTLALVGKNSKGELTLDFINESELPLNCVYIQNLTGRTFTLELPKPPSGEKSAIELPSKSTYIFGKNSTDSNISRTTPANLTYMTRLKNGKVVKVKDRGMMLTTYPGRKVVMIISPDSTGRTVVLTELMIFKERPGAASSDK